MNEIHRLEELRALNIFDTPPEAMLDELTLMASEICDTPIALITLLDEHRQWFKSIVGLALDQTPVNDSFCQYALHKPYEVLVIEDTLNDKRFINNPLVTGYPKIRFYAGAPLVTSQGNVLGTICVIDTKPRKISENKKKVLQILAVKTIKFFEGRRLALIQEELIELNAHKLLKLTNKLPLVIFQFEMTPDGQMSFPFISEGITALHSELDVKSVQANPELGFRHIHPEDLPYVKQSIIDSFENLTEWKTKFRVIHDNGKVEWHFGKSIPEKKDNGNVVWYGTFQNITNRVEYESALEQICFDISHVLRRPVTTLLGLSSLIMEDDTLNEVKLKEYSHYINVVSTELNNYTKKLAETYSLKNQIINGHNRTYQ